MIYDRSVMQSLPAGSWDAGIVRATSAHDNTGAATDVDDGFVAHWAELATKPYVRGAYHYANPDGRDSATTQAMIFAHTLLVHGWRQGKDVWALDLEGAVQRHGADLTVWVRQFMTAAEALLGDTGMLYVGWPWFEESGADISILHEYRWWLPAYGPNNGTDHGVTPGLPVTPLLHQFTSVPFDKSNIVNATAWHEMFLEDTVAAQFNPPLSIVSWTQFHDSKGRTSVAGVASSGAVFCIPGDAYMGGANGKPYFQGRKAARIVANPHGEGYVIEATSKETYGPKF